MLKYQCVIDIATLFAGPFNPCIDLIQIVMHNYFQDKKTFFRKTERIWIVWEILKKTAFDDNQATGI